MAQSKDSSWLRLLVGLTIFASTLGLYHLNGKALPGGDTVPSRYLPLSIICSEDFDLNEFPLGTMGRDGSVSLPYFLVRGKQKHRVYSTYGVGAGVMAVPVFAAAMVRDQVFTYGRILSLAKWAASLMIAFSAALLFWICAPLIGLWGAVVVALVWALGTSAWGSISQSLWQHSAAAPWLMLALLCLVRGKQRDAWLPWAGLCLGFATFCRSTNLAIALPLAMYVWLHHRKAFWQFAFLASIPAALLFAYNTSSFGHPLTFGQMLHTERLAKMDIQAAGGFSSDPLHIMSGFFGLMWSPSRGLFVFSPVLLFGAWALWRSWRSEDGDPLLRWASIACASVILLHSFWFNWWGGWSYGYRLPFDMVFLMVFAITSVWDQIKAVKWRRWAFGGALAFSIWVQILGAFSYDIKSWNGMPDVDRNYHRMWSLTDSQLGYYLRNPSWKAPLSSRDCPTWTYKVCPVKVYWPKKRTLP